MRKGKEEREGEKQCERDERKGRGSVLDSGPVALTLHFVLNFTTPSHNHSNTV